MGAIEAFLAGKLAFVLGGVGIGLGLTLAGRLVPGLVSKFVGGQLVSLLNIQTKDPVESKLIHDVVLALVRLAEYKIPEKGAGEARYKLVVDRLVALVPPLKGQEEKLAALIESAVAAMDAELKKAGEQPPLPLDPKP